MTEHTILGFVLAAGFVFLVGMLLLQAAKQDWGDWK